MLTYKPDTRKDFYLVCQVPNIKRIPAPALITQHKKKQHTLASADTTSQFPDLKSRLLLPMRFSISVGVSSGPLANGVCLHKHTIFSLFIKFIIEEQIYQPS